MKTILFVVVGFFFILAGCRKEGEHPQGTIDSTAGPANGVKLESQEGRFSVVLPDSSSIPKDSSIDVPTDVGPVTMHMFTANTGEGKTFVISYNDYPEFAFVKTIDRMMDDIRDSVMKNLSATLESQKDFTFAGSPTRSLDFTIEADSMKGYGRMQYMIIKPRLYQLIFLSNDEAARHDSVIHQTFASFNVLK